MSTIFLKMSLEATQELYKVRKFDFDNFLKKHYMNKRNFLNYRNVTLC